MSDQPIDPELFNARALLRSAQQVIAAQKARIAELELCLAASDTARTAAEARLVMIRAVLANDPASVLKPHFDRLNDR